VVDRHCTECGATLQERVKFCGQCGTAVVDPAQPEPSAKERVIATEAPRVSVAPVSGAETWSKGGTIIGILVVIGIAFVFTYFKFLRQPSTAAKIENIITSNSFAADPVCTKIGLINLAGARSDLYECAASNWNHCYVYNGGGAYDVTTNVEALVKLEKLAGTYDASTDNFACAS
jgi:hypothetical protein